MMEAKGVVGGPVVPAGGKHPLLTESGWRERVVLLGERMREPDRRSVARSGGTASRAPASPPRCSLRRLTAGPVAVTLEGVIAKCLDIIKLKGSPGPRPSTSMQPETPQQFCLRWNNYQSNLTSVFDQLLQSESFVDVTLACDGHSIKAHKMVLSACSPYFKQLFVDNPCQHPIVILKDVNWPELKSMVEFMYKGEINVSQDQINPLLKVAENLKIRGLADVNSEDDSLERKTHKRENSAEERNSSSPLQLQKKRRRKCSPERKSLSSPDISPGPGDRSDTPNDVSVSLTPHPPQQPQQQQQQQQLHQDVVPCPLPPAPPLPVDDLEIKPGIAEMIREEERVSLFLNSVQL